VQHALFLCGDFIIIRNLRCKALSYISSIAFDLFKDNVMMEVVLFQFWEWFVKFRNPADILEKHPDFLKLELTHFTCTLLTFIHGKL